MAVNLFQIPAFVLCEIRLAAAFFQICQHTAFFFHVGTAEILQEGFYHVVVRSRVVIHDLVHHAGITGLEVLTQEAHAKYGADCDMG